MLLGYQKFGIWVLASFFLVIVAANAQGRWNYNDVDLRIAERRAIPHYIRHGVEYPDIDIKSIMRQRGMLPRPQNYMSATHPTQRVNNSYRKSLAMSNHLETKHSRYNKKNKPYSKYGGKYKKQRYS